MNAHDFRKMVTGAGADPNVYWLVELYTLWHPACVALEPVLADLSLRYATPGLRFGKVDVSRYPQIAADMNVSVTGSSRQLPTLIMFKAGKELGRIPHVYEGGNVAKGVFRRKAIEKVRRGPWGLSVATTRRRGPQCLGHLCVPRWDMYPVTRAPRHSGAAPFV